MNIGFPEAGEGRGELVLALVIVHAHLLVFFEGGVVLAEDFGFGSSWTEFEVRFKVKVQGYGVGIGSHCSFAEEKQTYRERERERESRWWDGIYQLDYVYLTCAPRVVLLWDSPFGPSSPLHTIPGFNGHLGFFLGKSMVLFVHSKITF